MNGKPAYLLISAIGVIMVVAAGCGGDDDNGAASVPSPSSGAAASSTGQPAPGPGQRITVSMTEFHLALSQQTFTPGNYTFVAVNDGDVTHAFKIEGPGVETSTGNVQPGETAELPVVLRAGRYEFDCPVPGHVQRGMKMEVTVGDGAAPVMTSSDDSGGGSGY